MLELRTALKKLLEPAFVTEQSPSVVPPLRPSGRPSVGPPEEEQPLERRLDTLVGLLRSLAEVSPVPAARLGPIEKATESLERVLKSLAAQGDAVALGQVIRVMAPLYEEAARAPSTEVWAQCAADCASRLLHTIADPSALVASAQKLLSANAEPTDPELSLLVWAKVAGAYALYMARTSLESRSARTRFVSAMRLIGESAAPRRSWASSSSRRWGPMAPRGRSSWSISCARCRARAMTSWSDHLEVCALLGAGDPGRGSGDARARVGGPSGSRAARGHAVFGREGPHHGAARLQIIGGVDELAVGRIEAMPGARCPSPRTSAQLRRKRSAMRPARPGRWRRARRCVP